MAVRRIIYDNYLGYVVDNEDLFYNASFQVINKSENKNIIKGYKLQHNSNLKFVYDVNRYKLLYSVLSKLSAEKLLKVIVKTIVTLESIKYSSFVQLSSTLVNFEDIYIDMNSMEPKLICLPLVYKNSNLDLKSIESKLLIIVSNYIYESDYMEQQLLRRFFEDCHSGLYLLDDIYKFIISGRYGIFDFSDFQPIGMHDVRRMSLVSEESEKDSIVIDKTEFVIGKNPYKVDAVISKSANVSREHCKIIFSDNTYYITDNNSTNGTFVNGNKIAKGQIVPINEGDNITIADVEYVAKMV